MPSFCAARNVFHVMRLHVEALGPHVFHPLPAATAIRALVHIDRGPSQDGACHQAQHGRQDQRLQFHDDSFGDWDGSFGKRTPTEAVLKITFL
jgi:hypothetical protein